MRNDKGEIVCDICEEPAVMCDWPIPFDKPWREKRRIDLCEECAADIRRRILNMLGDEDC